MEHIGRWKISLSLWYVSHEPIDQPQKKDGGFPLRTVLAEVKTESQSTKFTEGANSTAKHDGLRKL